MFCVIPANRPCLTDFVTISPTQFAFSFPSNPHFSHLVVFILPGSTLPQDTAAGVHIQLPGSTDFKFLGAIGNEKPSAIFKVNIPGQKTVPGNINGGDVDAMTDSITSPSLITSPPDLGPINLGISVEPAVNIQAQLTSLQLQRQKEAHSPGLADAGSTALVIHQQPPRTKVLAQRIIKDQFNFLASFTGGGGPSGQEVVPLKVFQDWWVKFERRVENDPGFLEKEAGD